MRWLIWCGVGLILLVCDAGLAVAGQPDKADSSPAVSGHVVGSDYRRVAGAKLKLVGEPQSSLDRKTGPWSVTRLAIADDNGKFEFKGPLPRGDYRIDVEAADYLEATRTITLGAEPRTEDFHLIYRAVLIKLWPRGGLDLTLIQPGSYVVFDTGQDEEGEPDFFKDGKITGSVQLVGLDVVGWHDKRARIRTGMNLGIGLTSIKEPAPVEGNPKATKDASGLLGTASVFVDLLKFARIEVGAIIGVSAGERASGSSLDGADDRGGYVAISLRTQLGDQLVKMLR